jgi:hypothetical protein
LAIIKNPANPNATQGFRQLVIVARGTGDCLEGVGASDAAPRRRDTKWLTEGGVIAAKDQVSVKEFLRIENQSEEKLEKVREPALKVAQTVLQ